MMSERELFINCVYVCRSSCPICFSPCTAYNTERLFIYSSTYSKKESAIFDVEHQITKKKFQIQRSINRNKSTEQLEELNVLMNQTKETEKKIDQIKMRNVRKIQNGSGINAEKRESPSILAKIKLKR